LTDANSELLDAAAGRCEVLAEQWRQDIDQYEYSVEGEAWRLQLIPILVFVILVGRMFLRVFKLSQ
jgi:hypothetical protein